MPYSVISSRRIPYDIDGTEIGLNNTGNINNAIVSWLTSSHKKEYNDENLTNVHSFDYYGTLWQYFIFFFPEKIEIEQISVSHTSRGNQAISLMGSNNTTNGVDGTWETATFPLGTPTANNVTSFWWRNIYAVSLSEPYKCIKIGFSIEDRFDTRYTKGIHLYGRKAAGETIDDILFCNASTGDELTALTDWGDRPEGTTVIKSFKVKNASTTKIANNVNLQLNHADFLMSFSSSGPWQATLDISSIPANSLSGEIFVKNTLGPPLLALGPKAARVIASVGSWT